MNKKVAIPSGGTTGQSLSKKSDNDFDFEWRSGGPGGSTAWDDVTGKPPAVTSLSGTNTGDQDLSGYSLTSHNHTGTYEPAKANIQTHISSAHAPIPTVATLASDQATGANVTPVTLTGLVFSYVANSKYRIWAMGNVQPGAATTGCGFQFDLSSAVTSISVQFFHQLASAGTLSGGHSIADDASVGVSSGMPATAAYPVTIFGLLVTGANAGTAQLRFRSETTAVTTCKAGFTLVVEKIA